MVDPDAMDRFARAVQRPEERLELDHAALLIGEWEHGAIDLSYYRGRLDEMAAAAVQARQELAGRPFSGVRAVSRVLFDQLGFRGNDDDYYDPRNSFLADVIDRRVGIPITLAVMMIEVARRTGVRVTGVGFPGHFLVRAFEEDRAVVIDPFHHGAVLGKEQLQELLVRVSGPDARLEAGMLAPVSKGQILTRMLSNLAGIYGRTGDLIRSLEVLERLHLLDAGNPKIERELASLRARVDVLN